jgi:hypothetical protein
MSHVYFIYDGEFTKIGITAGDVKVRMSSLQSPRELVCLGTLPGDRELERRLHGLFAERRARGEWFEGEIGVECAEKAIQEDEERQRQAEERRRAEVKEAKTQAIRCKTIAEWLAARTGSHEFRLSGLEDWDSPFVHMRYLPILSFLDACAESGADMHSAQAHIRLLGALAL